MTLASSVGTSYSSSMIDCHTALDVSRQQTMWQSQEGDDSRDQSLPVGSRPSLVGLASSLISQTGSECLSEASRRSVTLSTTG